MRTFWIDGNANKLSAASCLRTPGYNNPKHLFSFSVMPKDLFSVRAKMKQPSYFGIWNDGSGVIGDYLGAPWSVLGSGWTWQEANGRPDRSKGAPAAWAQAELALGPMPAHRFAIGDIPVDTIPQWATIGDCPTNPSSPDCLTNPGWALWTDYENHLRDFVRVYMQRYPHMSPRFYELTGEHNWMTRPATDRPGWTAAQTVALYTRIGKLIKAIDPEAKLLGLTAAGTDYGPSWWKPFFDAGLLKVIDGLSFHPYHTGQPEFGRLATLIGELRALMRQYIKQPLPLYAKEWGRKSRWSRGLGPDNGFDSMHHEHARLVLRGNLILQGEGVASSIVFLLRDYENTCYAEHKNNCSFGLFYNHGSDPPNSWRPTQLTPKPIVSALATQLDLLSGTRPIDDLRDPAQGVWGYVFADDARQVRVVWTPFESRPYLMSLPGVPVATVIDMMGRKQTRPVLNGQLLLNVSGSAQYVLTSPIANCCPGTSFEGTPAAKLPSYDYAVCK
jgi:hypothetical protein